MDLDARHDDKLPAVAERIGGGLAASFAAIFFVSGLFYLVAGRWRITHTDFWYLYDCCLHRPWLSCAIELYGGHPLFFPTLVWTANIDFFHNDQRLLFIVGLVLMLLSVTPLFMLVWRDATLSATTKLGAVLVVVVGNFWTTRGAITASGGFTIICSLALGAAVVAVFSLPRQERGLRGWLLILAAAFVASFSFGTGLAVWPTLIIVGWAQRLSHRSLVVLIAAATLTAVTYVLLPGNVYAAATPRSNVSWLATCAGAVEVLCRLVGAPIVDAAAALLVQNRSFEASASSLTALFIGGAALLFGAVAVVPRLVRRDLRDTGVELVGVTLIIFNLFALALIVAGRTIDLGPFTSSQQLAGATRYVFWCTLFWSGLLLITIARAEKSRLSRSVTLACVLLIPLLVFPQHLHAAAGIRRASFISQTAGTALLCGVRDSGVIRILGPDPRLIYQVADEYRQRRLDVFASSGVQDWIGRTDSDFTSARAGAFALHGTLRVDATMQCDDGAPAARFRGRVTTTGEALPDLLLVIDQTGTVCGLARPTWSRGRLTVRQQLFGFGATGFIGYIRHYDAAQRYVVRAMWRGGASRDTVVIQPSPPPLNAASCATYFRDARASQPSTCADRPGSGSFPLSILAARYAGFRTGALR